MSGPEPGVPMQNPETPCPIEDVLNIFFSDTAAFLAKYEVSSEQSAWLAVRTIGQQVPSSGESFEDFGKVVRAYQKHNACNTPLSALSSKKT